MNGKQRRTLVPDGAVDRLDPVANSHIVFNLNRGAELQLYPDAGMPSFQDQAMFVSQIESFLRHAHRR